MNEKTKASEMEQLFSPDKITDYKKFFTFYSNPGTDYNKYFHPVEELYDFEENMLDEIFKTEEAYVAYWDSVEKTEAVNKKKNEIEKEFEHYVQLLDRYTEAIVLIKDNEKKSLLKELHHLDITKKNLNRLSVIYDDLNPNLSSHSETPDNSAAVDFFVRDNYKNYFDLISKISNTMLTYLDAIKS